MLRPAGAMQGVDLLRTDRVASSAMWRSVRVLAVLVCGVAVLLSVGGAPAFGGRVSKAEEAEAAAHEENFVYRPSGITDSTEECFSFENICHEGKSFVPP